VVVALLSVLLKGVAGLSDLLKGVSLAAVIVVVVIIAMSRLWLATGLALLTLTFSIPLPILRRLPLAVPFFALLFPIILGRAAILKTKEITLRDSISRIMILAAAIIIARFLYDRPGSVWFGGRGGGGEAVVFVVGGISFFTAGAVYGAARGSEGKTLRFLVALLVVVQFVLLAAQLRQGLRSLVGLSFYRPMWFLGALWLAWSVNRTYAAKGTRLLPYYVASVMILILSVITPHRSRPLYAAAMIIMVAMNYGVTRRVLRFLALVSVGGLIILVALGPERLPVAVRRSLSTVIPSLTGTEFVYEAGELGISSERGWQSEFRRMLYRVGLRRIREHPLVGNGFAFTLEELLFATLGYGDLQRATAALFGTSGTYHNSLLELGVFCGLPVVLLFVSAYLLAVVRFFRLVRRSAAGTPEKLLGSALLGFLVAQTGQMLINGAAYDFFVVSIVVGVAAAWSAAESRSRIRLNEGTRSPEGRRGQG